jgi:hypothetical protein
MTKDKSPFEDLPELPVDVADCLEHFKLAIIRHRADNFHQVSREDLLRVCLALASFVDAPRLDERDEKIGRVYERDGDKKEFLATLRKYVSDHPEGHVRFAASMIHRDFVRLFMR